MMEIQTQHIDEDVLRLIEQKNRPITFRDLMIRLPDSVDPQSVWNSLRILQERKVIEAVKISNRKTGWKLQWHVSEGLDKNP